MSQPGAFALEQWTAGCRRRALRTLVLCVSGCTGGANGGFFGKEDVAVLLLTSVAAILLRCASRGGSVQSSAHTSLPCSVEVCVCVCVHSCCRALHSSLVYCKGNHRLYLQQGLCFLSCVFVLIDPQRTKRVCVCVCLREIAVFAMGHISSAHTTANQLSHCSSLALHALQMLLFDI